VCFVESKQSGKFASVLFPVISAAEQMCIFVMLLCEARSLSKIYMHNMALSAWMMHTVLNLFTIEVFCKYL